MSDQETLWIVVEEPIEGGRDSTVDVGGGFGVSQKIANVLKQRVPVDAAALKSQMNGLLKVVGGLFEEAEQQTGMQLNEVTLSVEINGQGKVSLLGTGGKLGNRGGITLKFTRSQSN